MVIQANVFEFSCRDTSRRSMLGKTCVISLVVVGFLTLTTHASAVTVPAPHTDASHPNHLIVGQFGIANQQNDVPGNSHSETWTVSPPGGGHWDFAQVTFHCDNMVVQSVFEHSLTGLAWVETESQNYSATRSFPANTTGNVVVSHDNTMDVILVESGDPEEEEEEEIDVGCTQYDFHVTLYYEIVAPGIPSSISTNSPTAEGNIVVTWGASSGVVTSYQLQESKDGGVYATVYNGTSGTKTLTARTPGSIYTYRVRAAAGSNGLYKYSAWRTSAPVAVPEPPPSSQSSIIYIHTDLLGSPVAESNEAGEIE